MAKNRGFTLVEMLVAIGILLVLSALTMSMVNVTSNADRIRSASRDVQAYLEGARNQATYSKYMRGVRFMRNPDDRTTVTSMVYIGPPQHFDHLTINVTKDSRTIGIPATLATAWRQFRQNGMLVDGATIKIPREHGNWYTIAQVAQDDWRLTKPFTGGTGKYSYWLALEPIVLPAQEPRTLPKGIAIDLDNSRLPRKWIVSPGVYSDHMDILFGPLGDTYGLSGKVHLVLSETADTTVNCPLPSTIATWTTGTPYAVGQWIVSTGTNEYQYLCTAAGSSGGSEPLEFSSPKVGETVTDGTATWLCHARKPSIIMSLTTGTGEVASHPLHPTDPFLYAETGKVAQ